MSSRLSFALSQAISGLQLAPLTVCLHMFISYAQIEAFKTKSGLLILRSIFTRAYQVHDTTRHAPDRTRARHAQLTTRHDTTHTRAVGVAGAFGAATARDGDGGAEHVGGHVRRVHGGHVGLLLRAAPTRGGRGRPAGVAPGPARGLHLCGPHARVGLPPAPHPPHLARPKGAWATLCVSCRVMFSQRLTMFTHTHTHHRTRTRRSRCSRR
jgi:hypothetical protein